MGRAERVIIALLSAGVCVMLAFGTLLLILTVREERANRRIISSIWVSSAARDSLLREVRVHQDSCYSPCDSLGVQRYVPGP